MAEGMKASRRRFFGIAAAPVVVAAVPAIAAPVVKMVEADIAPVSMPPVTHPFAFTATDVTLSVEDWMESYTRPQMLRLSREIDAEVRKALYG